MSLHTGVVLELDSPQRLKALADDTRTRILQILRDSPASAKDLATDLGMSHGKVGHHIKVLRENGFIEVVEERPVRALTEKIYAPAFDRLVFTAPGSDRLRFALEMIAREAVPAEEQPFEPPAMVVTARMSERRAAEFHARCRDLMEEFLSSEEPEAEEVFGIGASVFLTGAPPR